MGSCRWKFLIGGDQRRKKTDPGESMLEDGASSPDRHGGAHVTLTYVNRLRTTIMRAPDGASTAYADHKRIGRPSCPAVRLQGGAQSARRRARRPAGRPQENPDMSETYPMILHPAGAGAFPACRPGNVRGLFRLGVAGDLRRDRRDPPRSWGSLPTAWPQFGIKHPTESL